MLSILKIQKPSHTRRRRTDYIRITLVIIGLLSLSLSCVAAIDAQSISKQIEDLKKDQQDDADKIASIEKRLFQIELQQKSIEANQSSSSIKEWGILLGVGTVLLGQGGGIVISHRRRSNKKSDEDEGEE